ncbi:MAG TPA: hypothetical protein VK164_07000 [Flavobacterium sp.]|uniref:hypothetical protein n=1 Tax=Flavobacterium sp. TaxID=239 RepID=UPI002B4AF18C|nr:hypothetical protein [Flavobacterium sp.]HLO73666.1 hypothetical protein [Flavobacterium sp.]
MTRIESTNKSLLIFVLLFLYSCNNNFLKCEKGNLIEVEYKQNHILIYEFDKSNKKVLKDLVKVEDEFFDNELPRKFNKNIKTKPFLSKKKTKYLIVDKFSLLNDSIIIKDKVNGFFCTEQKSNIRPVCYKFFYSENYEIKKIEIRIGKDFDIYK